MGKYSYTIKISGLSDDDIFDEVQMIINKLKRVKGLKEVGGGLTNNGSIREFMVDNDRKTRK